MWPSIVPPAPTDQTTRGPVRDASGVALRSGVGRESGGLIEEGASSTGGAGTGAFCTAAGAGALCATGSSDASRAMLSAATSARAATRSAHRRPFISRAFTLPSRLCTSSRPSAASPAMCTETMSRMEGSSARLRVPGEIAANLVVEKLRSRAANVSFVVDGNGLRCRDGLTLRLRCRERQRRRPRPRQRSEHRGASGTPRAGGRPHGSKLHFLDWEAPNDLCHSTLPCAAAAPRARVTRPSPYTSARASGPPGRSSRKGRPRPSAVHGLPPMWRSSIALLNEVRRFSLTAICKSGVPSTATTGGRHLPAGVKAWDGVLGRHQPVIARSTPVPGPGPPTCSSSGWSSPAFVRFRRQSPYAAYWTNFNFNSNSTGLTWPIDKCDLHVL